MCVYAFVCEVCECEKSYINNNVYIYVYVYTLGYSSVLQLGAVILRDERLDGDRGPRGSRVPIFSPLPAGREQYVRANTHALSHTYTNPQL